MSGYSPSISSCSNSTHQLLGASSGITPENASSIASTAEYDSTATHSEPPSTKERFEALQKKIEEQLQKVNNALDEVEQSELNRLGYTLVQPLLKKLSDDLKNQKIADDSWVLRKFYKENIENYSNKWIDYIEGPVFELINLALKDEITVSDIDKLSKICDDIETQKPSIEELEKEKNNPSFWKTFDIKSLGNSLALILAFTAFKILGVINSACNAICSSLALFKNYYIATLTRYQTLLNNIKENAKSIQIMILKSSNRRLEGAHQEMSRQQAELKAAHIQLSQEVISVQKEIIFLRKEINIVNRNMNEDTDQVEELLSKTFEEPLRNSLEFMKGYVETLNATFESAKTGAFYSSRIESTLFTPKNISVVN